MSDDKGKSDVPFKIIRKDDAWETKFKQEGKYLNTSINLTTKDDGTKSIAAGAELDVGKRLNVGLEGKITDHPDGTQTGQFGLAGGGNAWGVVDGQVKAYVVDLEDSRGATKGGGAEGGINLSIPFVESEVSANGGIDYRNTKVNEGLIERYEVESSKSLEFELTNDRGDSVTLYKWENKVIEGFDSNARTTSSKNATTHEGFIAHILGIEGTDVVENNTPETYPEGPNYAYDLPESGSEYIPPYEGAGTNYVVSKGDTLSDIAYRFELNEDDILHHNPQITDPNKIYPDDEIWLPIEDYEVPFGRSDLESNNYSESAQSNPYEQQFVDTFKKTAEGLPPLTGDEPQLAANGPIPGLLAEDDAADTASPARRPADESTEEGTAEPRPLGPAVTGSLGGAIHGVGEDFGELIAGAFDLELEPAEMYDDVPQQSQPTFSQTADASVYALNSALMLQKAIERDDELATATGGVNFLNQLNQGGMVDFGKGTGEALDTWGGNLGLVSGGLNFADAIDSGRGAQIISSGASLASHAVSMYAQSVSGAAAQASAQNLSSNLGSVAGAINIAMSLKAGDEMGAMIGAITMVNPVLGTALAVGRALWGGEKPPYSPANGDGEFVRESDGTISIHTEGDNANYGDHAEMSLRNRMGDDLEHDVAVANIDSLLETPMSMVLEELQGQLTDDTAIIPERLPELTFSGHFYIIKYDDPTTGEARQVAAAPSDVLDTLTQVAYHSQAVAPAWEAEMVEQRLEAGEENYWYTQEQAAYANDEVHDTGEFNPVVLDLNGDDTAMTLDAGNLFFDADDDGYQEQTEWLSPQDGFLALDRNLDGQIDQGSEIFANNHAQQGLESLAWFDIDHNSVINSDDPVYSALQLWVDINPDAAAEFGEVFSLYQAGITELDYQNGTFTTQDGQTHSLLDVELSASDEGYQFVHRQGGTLVSEEDGETLFYAQRDEPVSERSGGGNVEKAPDRIVIHGPQQGGSEEKDPRRELRNTIDTRHLTPFSDASAGLLAVGLGMSASQTHAGERVSESDYQNLADVAFDEGHTGQQIQTGATEFPLAAEPDVSDQSNNPMPGLEGVVEDGDNRVSGDARSFAGLSYDSETTSAYQGDSAAPTGALPGWSEEIVETETGVAAGATRSDPISVEDGKTPDINHVPLANNDRFDTSEDAIVEIDVSALLANDIDLDKDTLRVSEVSAAEHGQVRLENGVVYFIPDENYNGEAGFEYLLEDGEGGMTIGRVKLDIAPVNDNPEALLDPLAAVEDITSVITVDQLASDVDGDVLSFSSVSNPSNGSVWIDGDGNVRFAPDADYYGEAGFDYTVVDGNGGSVSARATLDIEAVNDAPRITSVNYTPVVYGYSLSYEYDSGTGGYIKSYDPIYDENSALQYDLDENNVFLYGSDGTVYNDRYDTGGNLVPVSVLENGEKYTGSVATTDVGDPDGEITYSIASNPVHGSASVNSSGDWSFSRGHGDTYSGNVSFTIAATDAHGDSNTTTITTTHHGFSSGGGKKPVALDLDKDGLEFVGVDDSNVFFDVNGDDWREQIGWTNEDDGLLVLDKDDDNIIDRLDEISFVGYKEGARTDLEGLQAFDSNNDGQLSAQDTDWEQFKVWQDISQDGISDTGEIFTLEQLDIASINLRSDGNYQEVDGITIFGETTYQHGDGSEGIVGDVMFPFDASNVKPPDPVSESGQGSITQAELYQIVEQLRHDIVTYDADSDSESPSLQIAEMMIPDDTQVKLDDEINQQQM